jgi:hypothetical protein
VVYLVAHARLERLQAFRGEAAFQGVRAERAKRHPNGSGDSSEKQKNFHITE